MNGILWFSLWMDDSSWLKTTSGMFSRESKSGLTHSFIDPGGKKDSLFLLCMPVYALGLKWVITLSDPWNIAVIFHWFYCCSLLTSLLNWIEFLAKLLHPENNTIFIHAILDIIVNIPTIFYGGLSSCSFPVWTFSPSDILDLPARC